MEPIRRHKTVVWALFTLLISMFTLIHPVLSNDETSEKNKNSGTTLKCALSLYSDVPSVKSNRLLSVYNSIKKHSTDTFYGKQYSLVYSDPIKNCRNIRLVQKSDIQIRLDLICILRV